MTSIFDHARYQPYLTLRLGGKDRRTGQRTAAAQALGCHPTFISLVLKEKAHLSIEQALCINDFLRHPKAEADYFVNLVQRERAGTQEARAYFDSKLDEIRKKRTDIKDRIQSKGEIAEIDQAKFYSDWLYGAVHVLASIPGKNTVEEIARHLGVTTLMAQETINFLLRLGLLKEESGRLQMASSHVHLSTQSPLLDQHHKNWRLCSLSKLGRQQPRGLHYSAALTLSKADAEELKEEFLRGLQKMTQRVQKSPPEVLYCYNFDFFQL